MMAAMRSASSTLPRPGRVDGQIIGLTLLIKFGLLVFGVVVVALVGRLVAPDLDGMSADRRPLFEPWVRWDAPHYLDLAVFGYRATVGGELMGRTATGPSSPPTCTSTARSTRSSRG